MFETDDLSKIALSTISRCRVIYFDENLIDYSIVGNLIEKEVQKNSIKKLQHLNLSLEEKKIVFFRMSELYKIHEAFQKNDVHLGNLLLAISTLSVLDQDKIDDFLAENDTKKLFLSFPQAYGQWVDLSIEKDSETKFWKMFLKRVLRSSLMLLVYGESGTGKSKFISDLVSTLDHEQ